MRPEPGERDRGFILDMVLSATDAVEFVRDLDEAEFRSSRLHQNAVIRAIEVVGEAAGRLSPEFRQGHDDVPWSEMIGMRHRLIHGYDKVRLEVVWEVARHELPRLLDVLARFAVPER